ncbi:hypothetical protein BABINDRAFT_23667, partial [Babjeviella inositovora NRRL Y-12698]
LLSLFTLLITAVAAQGVLELTKKNFDEVVLQADKHTLVEFYASWCSHCKRMLPQYEELAELFHSKTDNVQVVKIDGDKYGKYAKRYSIEGYPTIKLFKNGGLKPEDIIEFEGSRDMESMRSFVLAHTKVSLEPVKLEPVKPEPAPVVRLFDANFEAKVLKSSRPSLIAITASWCGHCKNLHPEFEEVARVYAHDDITIGVVQTTDEEETSWIRSTYDIKSYPTILFFDGVDPQPTPYLSGRSLPTFVEYINARAHLYRYLDGELLPHAGVITKVHDKLQEIYAGDDVHAELAELASEIENDDWMAKWDTSSYYVKLINKALNGQEEFYTREQTRLGKILEKSGASLVQDKKDTFQKRINVLKSF